MQVTNQNFQPHQVVFIKDDKKLFHPAKIIKKSCYGTYKVKFYGSKQEQYASQYMIQSYTKQRALALSSQHKKDKKYQKNLKTAEKDNAILLQKTPQITKIPRICKQEQQQNQEEANNNQKNSSKKSIPKTRYQAILNIKISNIIDNYEEDRQIACIYNYNGYQRVFYKNMKELLLIRLQWALQDIYIQHSNQNTQIVISQIMDTDFIQPVEYVTTELFDKLGLAIQYLKKNKKAKFKNYLLGKQNSILAGVENYLNNFTLFLRVKQNFNKWLNTKDKIQKVQKLDQNISISQVELRK